jgi:hypothetical protein
LPHAAHDFALNRASAPQRLQFFVFFFFTGCRE